MSKIILTRGLPASGKTTWARQEAMLRPRAVRVSRDDLRSQMYPGAYYRDIDEDLITVAETALVRAALQQGKTVVVDAMHLQQRYINRWQRLGYPIDIKEFHAPLETLLYCNDVRGDKVPASVIVDNYKKFTNKDGSLKKVRLEPEKYITSQFPKYDTFRDIEKPEAFIFDIDGTLAHNDGHRSFYDYSKVYEDKVVYEVMSVANDLNNSHHIVVVSGRKDECYDDTERWLTDHMIQFDELIMREDGDDRPDSLVKYEILRDQVAPNYDVIGVFDDRPSVCEMWRNVGIPTFQVGDPDNRF